MVALNVVQVMNTVHALYVAIVVDSFDVYSLLDDEWAISMQIGIMSFLAAISQGFFTYRLQTVKPSLLLNSNTIMLVVLEFIFAVVSMVETFHLGYAAVMIFHHGYWLMYDSFATSARLSLCVYLNLACVLYVVRRRGQAAGMEKAEFQTLQSLMGCGLLSVFAAILLGIRTLNLVWLVATCLLGSLYTLSVLLSLRSNASVVDFSSIAAEAASRHDWRRDAKGPTSICDLSTVTPREKAAIAWSIPKIRVEMEEPNGGEPPLVCDAV
ncbi:hypothetical protein L227DRAFT_31294 [Lentinus tigrinus ALCF2SS1-6]|uniref:Uncharacterized protein n=2 Tax=Lentinus tigrinus TaxID=5365 RepID=A0A5C2SEN1_9APHY|nr:hypothetical protein L227DRAFT_31294 [Lentinus tigrinus ALCF2SS1-6]